LAKAIEEAMPQNESNGTNFTIAEPVLRGFLTAGGTVMKNNESSIHPSWRSAYALILGTNVSAIRKLAPEMGSYLNEVCLAEGDENDQ
jgi:hypothetical protein